MGHFIFLSILTFSFIACKQRPQSDLSRGLSTDQRIEVIFSEDRKSATIIDGLSDPVTLKASSLFASVHFVPPAENGTLPTRSLKGEQFFASGVNQFTGQIALGVRAMNSREHNWSMVFLVDRADIENPKLVRLYRRDQKSQSIEPRTTNPFDLITKIQFQPSGELWVTHKSAFEAKYGDGYSLFHETVKFDKNLNVLECVRLPQGTPDGICFDEPQVGDF